MFHKKIIFSCPCQAPCKEFDKRIDRMATREPQWDPSNSLRLYNKWGCPHHICCLALGSCVLYDYKNEKSGDHARLLVLQTEALRLPFPVERATSDPTPIWYIYSWKGYNHTTWHLLVALLWQGIEISQVSVCHEQALSKRLPKFYIVPSSRSNSRQSRLPYCHRHGIRLQMYNKLLTPQSFYKYFLRKNKKYIVSCQLYARMYTYTVYLYKNY